MCWPVTASESNPSSCPVRLPPSRSRHFVRVPRGRVVQLQEILAFWGYYQSRIDGQYGPRTVAAVQEWQTALASLNVGRADGVYGPRTHAAAAASYATLAALRAA